MAEQTMSKWIPTTDLLELRRLGKLGEELGEAASVAARCIIQGIDATDPASGKVNRERLENELADVQAQIGCTVLAFALDQDRMARRTAGKMRQMADWEALFSAPGVTPTVRPPDLATVARAALLAYWSFRIDGAPQEEVDAAMARLRDAAHAAGVKEGGGDAG